MQGITYQVKILTWVAWKLLQQDPNVHQAWYLGTEVGNAVGLHDLVLKYKDKELNGHCNRNTSHDKWMYRFVQIKHKLVVKKDNKIMVMDLKSKQKKNQHSLIYLFQSYMNMLGNFEKITPEQIRDMTIFTNRHIKNIKFLVQVDSDKIFGFEEKGKRYSIDLDLLSTHNPGIMESLRKITPNDVLIRDFLSKLRFAVDQPSECEVEGLIMKEMSKFCQVPQMLYNNLYKNMLDWFLIYHDGKAPYLTIEHLVQYMKNTQDILQKCNTKTSEDISKIIDSILLVHL